MPNRPITAADLAQAIKEAWDGGNRWPPEKTEAFVTQLCGRAVERSVIAEAFALLIEVAWADAAFDLAHDGDNRCTL